MLIFTVEIPPHSCFTLGAQIKMSSSQYYEKQRYHTHAKEIPLGLSMMIELKTTGGCCNVNVSEQSGLLGLRKSLKGSGGKLTVTVIHGQTARHNPVVYFSPRKSSHLESKFRWVTVAREARSQVEPRWKKNREPFWFLKEELFTTVCSVCEIPPSCTFNDMGPILFVCYSSLKRVI